MNKQGDADDGKPSSRKGGMKSAKVVLARDPSMPQPIVEAAARRGYVNRELVQCTLPHSDPGDVEVYTRQDGHLIFAIRSGYDYRAKRRVGLPYGSIPRLLLLWIISEANRTGEARIVLGDRLNDFLRDVGLDPNTGGGKRGDAKRLREQMLRLFTSEISFEYTEGNAEQGGVAWANMPVAPKGCLWWDFKQPDQQQLFTSYIILGDDFLKAVTTNAVPVDLTLAGKLKRSPFALDLFVWATYRTYRLKASESVVVSYKDLQQQFGAEYKELRNFRAALRDALAKVEGVWPAIAYSLTPRGLVLRSVDRAALPVRAKLPDRMLSRRKSGDPFDLTAADLIKANDHAPGWDVRELRREWASWCQGQGIVPDNGLAHFISFLKAHKRRNG